METIPREWWEHLRYELDKCSQCANFSGDLKTEKTCDYLIELMRRIEQGEEWKE